jgi:hypothetical protein
MNDKLYNLIEFLAGNYGFDADEAFEAADDEGHIANFMVKEEKPKKEEPKKEEPKKEEPKKEEGDKNSPLEKTRHNVALWTKKLGENKFKDDEAKQKHIAKLDKEKAKLAKLEPAAEKPAEKAAPAKKSTEKTVTVAKEKRIKRMSSPIAGQLKTALEAVKLEMDDKLKKEFVQYVEDLTDEDFKKQGLADHTRDFAKLKAPAPEEELDEEEEEAAEEDDSGAGTGLKPSTDKPVTLTLKELQAISMTATLEPGNTIWDADKGRVVNGPEAVDDEDIDEVTFEGNDYGGGEKSGRVYLEVNDKDVFQGFIGVGKFKNMKRA